MSDLVIEVRGVSKAYRIFRRARWRILDALGLPVPRTTYEESWALQDVTLSVLAGQRLGIIGRNGSGKSTLLKIVAGLLQRTEGTVVVRGQVETLMDLGTGFHPEFTGRQNVLAALSYRGITGKEALRCFDEIVDFSELEECIDHPVKSYSTGMHARLAFAVTTVIKPGILIIDEVLSAGDAYFAGKCLERMKQLTVGRDATVLFVSHDLSAVQALCDRVIWLRQGRICQDGEPLTVLKAYYKEVQEEENRHMALTNRRVLPQQAVPSAPEVESGPADACVALPGERSPHSVVTWQVPDPRIETVRFWNSQGKPVTSIQEGEALLVEIRYFASAPVQAPVFAMSIYRLDGTPVCSAINTLGGLEIARIHGHGKLRFVFTPFYGGPGEYVVSVTIYKSFGRTPSERLSYYDCHDRAYRFRVWKRLDNPLDPVLIQQPYTVEHLVAEASVSVAEDHPRDKMIPQKTHDGPIEWERPILVGCCGSSGSTLLSVMLDAHPEVLCGPELNLFAHPFFWTQEGSVWQDRLLRYLDLGSMATRLPEWTLGRGMCPFTGLVEEANLSWYRVTVPALQSLVRQSSNARELVQRLYTPVLQAHGKRIWAEKSPPNLYAFRDFLNCYPNGRVVCLVRDGRDVVGSLLRRKWGSFKKALSAWLVETAICESYADHPRVFRVRYEDLVLHPRKTVEDLLGFLQLSPEVDCVLDYRHVSSRVASDASSAGSPAWRNSPWQPISTTSVESWRDVLTPEHLTALSAALIVHPVEGHSRLEGQTAPLLLDRLGYKPVDTQPVQTAALFRLLIEEKLFLSGGDYTDPNAFHERFVECDAARLPGLEMAWTERKFFAKASKVPLDLAELKAQYDLLQRDRNCLDQERKALQVWQSKVLAMPVVRIAHWARRFVLKLFGLQRT